MDITPLYFQIIKTKKNENSGEMSSPESQLPEPKSTFNTKICELVASINHMKKYLFDNKTDYINI